LWRLDVHAAFELPTALDDPVPEVAYNVAAHTDIDRPERAHALAHVKDRLRAVLGRAVVQHVQQHPCVPLDQPHCRYIITRSTRTDKDKLDGRDTLRDLHKAHVERVLVGDVPECLEAAVDAGAEGGLKLAWLGDPLVELRGGRHAGVRNAVTTVHELCERLEVAAAAEVEVDLALQAVVLNDALRAQSADVVGAQGGIGLKFLWAGCQRGEGGL
jgi:hypothetical protein